MPPTLDPRVWIGIAILVALALLAALVLLLAGGDRRIDHIRIDHNTIHVGR